MRLHARAKHLTATFTVLGLLSACGGGGDEDTSNSPQGVYAGTMSGGAGTSNAFRMLVLENNEAWTLYGNESGASFAAGGFVQGTGTVSNNVYTSSDAKDFGYTPAVAGSARATFAKIFGGTSINGTFTPVSGAPAQFSGATISGFNYNTAAQLSTLAGAWSNGLTLNVNGTTGNFSGTWVWASGTCTFTGTTLPRPTGKNVFNVSMNFGAACPAAIASQTTGGVALAYPVTVGSTTYTQLLVGVVNTGRTAGATLVTYR